MRSTRSSGISGIVEAVRGDGRTGRVGFVSILNDLIRDNESGIGAPLVLNGELGPPRFRLMVTVIMFPKYVPLQPSYSAHGLRPSCRLACQLKGQVCSEGPGMGVMLICDLVMPVCSLEGFLARNRWVS